MICGIRLPAGRSVRLDALLAALPCRKSDIGAAWIDEAVGLGWRGASDGSADRNDRLLRVERDSGLVVTASVRLDDRAALCAALDVPHARRADLPDSALILRAYERWGRECPGHLLGDYAFAVWDAKRRSLFCARDHIGARPFHYCWTAGRFVFASEVNAVLAAPGVPDELDQAAVATRLTHGLRPLGARTFFRAVRRLPPGHMLEVDGDAPRVVRWWRPEDAPVVPAGDDDAVGEAFRDLHARAVRDRVHGVSRVGVHLSGGLDSSSVAVLAARELRLSGRRAPVAFSWHPPLDRATRNATAAAEYGLIEAVARQEGLQVFYCTPSGSDVLAYLRRDSTRDPELIPHEEPVLRRAAENGVRLILSGWGGDEGISFNGRGYYPQLLRSGHLGRLWRQARERSRHPLGAILLHAVLPLVFPGGARAIRDIRRGRWPARSCTFIHPRLARVRLLSENGHVPVGVRRTQLHLLRLGHLGDRIDGWTVSGARYGVEYGYPLLDRRVLEFALGLPAEQFRRGRWSRWLMRHALRPILPPEVCWNPSKADPARLDPFLDTFAEVLPAVRMRLATRSQPPSRSAYLDMPRLMAHLNPDRFRADPCPGPMMNALRFLDF